MTLRILNIYMKRKQRDFLSNFPNTAISNHVRGLGRTKKKKLRQQSFAEARPTNEARDSREIRNSWLAEHTGKKTEERPADRKTLREHASGREKYQPTLPDPRSFRTKYENSIPSHRSQACRKDTVIMFLTRSTEQHGNFVRGLFQWRLGRVATVPHLPQVKPVRLYSSRTDYGSLPKRSNE